MRALPRLPAVLRLIEYIAQAAHTGRMLALSCTAVLSFHAAATPSVADAGATPAPLLHRAPPGTAAGVETGQTDWRAAHRAVGEFPRGHADIVAWERRQMAAQQPPGVALPAIPPISEDHSHHHHGHGAAAPEATP